MSPKLCTALLAHKRSVEGGDTAVSAADLEIALQQVRETLSLRTVGIAGLLMLVERDRRAGGEKWGWIQNVCEQTASAAAGMEAVRH